VAVILRQSFPPGTYSKGSVEAILKRHAKRLGDDEKSVGIDQMGDIEAEVRTM